MMQRTYNGHAEQTCQKNSSLGALMYRVKDMLRVMTPTSSREVVVLNTGSCSRTREKRSLAAAGVGAIHSQVMLTMAKTVQSPESSSSPSSVACYVLSFSRCFDRVGATLHGLGAQMDGLQGMVGEVVTITVTPHHHTTRMATTNPGSRELTALHPGLVQLAPRALLASKQIRAGDLVLGRQQQRAQVLATPLVAIKVGRRHNRENQYKDPMVVSSAEVMAMVEEQVQATPDRPLHQASRAVDTSLQDLVARPGDETETRIATRRNIQSGTVLYDAA